MEVKIGVVCKKCGLTLEATPYAEEDDLDDTHFTISVSPCKSCIDSKIEELVAKVMREKSNANT